MGYYIRLLIVSLLLTSCVSEDVLVIDLLPPPTLEIDGRLPIDNNGYYHLSLNQNTNQTIHRVVGIVEDYEFYSEPMKVEWVSNLSWQLTDEFDVATSNQSSYVIDGEVSNIIAPTNTMVGDTLVLTGTIREYLVSNTIKIVLE